MAKTDNQPACDGCRGRRAVAFYQERYLCPGCLQVARQTWRGKTARMQADLEAALDTLRNMGEEPSEPS